MSMCEAFSFMNPSNRQRQDSMRCDHSKLAAALGCLLQKQSRGQRPRTGNNPVQQAHFFVTHPLKQSHTGLKAGFTGASLKPEKWLWPHQVTRPFSKCTNLKHHCLCFTNWCKIKICQCQNKIDIYISLSVFYNKEMLHCLLWETVGTIFFCSFHFCGPLFKVIILSISVTIDFSSCHKQSLRFFLMSVYCCAVSRFQIKKGQRKLARTNPLSGNVHHHLICPIFGPVYPWH